jgi:SsrA-binding protein
MAKKKVVKTKQISNRRARHDYELGDNLLVGIELLGREVKNLRSGHGQLRGAFVNVKDNELFLVNATINGTNAAPLSEAEQTRTRKLLAKRREIDHLVEAKHQGKTIVPLEVLTGGRFIKVRISLGKGKKLYDKRHTLKARDDKRRTDAELKRAR